LLKLGLIRGRKSGRDDLVARGKRDLAARDQCQLFGDGRINLVSNGHNPELPALIVRAGGNRPQEHAIELSFAVPPGRLVTLLHGPRQVFFRNVRFPARVRAVKSQHLSVRPGEQKKLAARQLPHWFRRVLNRRGVLGGHQCFQRGKFRQHRGSSGELQFALLLHIFERAQRFVRAFLHSLINLGAHGMPHDQ